MRKFLSLVLALAMAMSLVVVNTSAKEFTDSDDLNYKEAVDVISEIDVVDGYTDGSFNPQGGLTRGAAAKIICNLILGPTTAAELRADTRPFSDVAVDSEFAGYIAYCAQQGIISGYADGEFKAANPLTGYAFMKMLLGALGYSTDIENYVGENWSINVAKQALGIGLNKGLVDEFNGVDYVTREEAALYAFNTLKATMVDYDNTISANVNGAEVVISNNTAKPVTWSEGINEDGNIKDDGFVQFAEEFFPDLVRKDDSTKFEEPANTWVYAKTEIGTYERLDLLVESYTTGVTGREIYDLLKSGVIDDNDLDVYLNGADNYGAAAGQIEKDDLVRSNTDDLGSTGNGVLTKVYLDTDKDLITIVSINTWLAQAVNDYSEANEYATLRVYKDEAGGKCITESYTVDVEDVPAVADVTKDTFYAVNISWKDNDKGEIVVIGDVEILEDSTITEYSSDDGNSSLADAKVTKLTTGGEEYNANVKAFYDDDILYQYDQSLLTDNTYNVYLDQYGYFLGVDLFEGSQNYVFITGFDRNTSNLAVKTATAGAIFLDGTMENIQVNVTDTDKNIDKAQGKGDNEDLFVKWTTGGYDVRENGGTPTDWADLGKYGEEGIYDLNQWYTYTVNESGVYTLKPCTRMTWTHYDINDANSDGEVVIRTDNLSVVDDYDAGRVYGEDATVFLTVDLDTVDTSHGVKAITDVNGVYTGVQDVDLLVNIKDQEAIDEGQVYTVFDSDGYVIAAVVIGEARGSTGNYAYILSDAKSERYEGGVYYWTFDAIMNGEKQTLTARSSYASTIDALVENTVQELRFDGDYVVDVKDVDNIYNNFTNTIKDEDVYLMNNATVDNTPNVVYYDGRTMYVTKERNDVGLAFVRDAKAVVIQDENAKKDVVTNFSDVTSAINHLADPDTTTPQKEYKGNIVAILNANGAAEWVVFDSATPLTSGSQGGYEQSGTDGLLTYGASNMNGFAFVNWTMTAPEYAAYGATVSYTVEVLANGNVIATYPETFTAQNGDMKSYGPIFAYDANATITVRLAKNSVSANSVAVKYVNEETNTTMYLDNWENGVKVDNGAVLATPTAAVSTTVDTNIAFSLKTNVAAQTFDVRTTGLTANVDFTAADAMNTVIINKRAVGTDFVTVYVDGFSGLQNTLSITTAANIDDTDDATNLLFGALSRNVGTNDGANRFTIRITDGAGMNAGDTFDTRNIEVGIFNQGAFTDNYSYKVTVGNLGSVVLTNGSYVRLPSKLITVNDDIVITSDMISVTVEEKKMAVESARWGSNTLTIVFTEDIESALRNSLSWNASDYTFTTDADGAGATPQFYSFAVTGNDRITITFSGEQLQAGDVITLANSGGNGLDKIYGPAGNGYNDCDLTSNYTLTLGANGTVALS